MGDEKTNKSSSVFNAIDQLDPSTQNEAYNQPFRQWRKNRENPYALNYEADSRERVYVDSRGFEVHSVEEAEKKALTNIVRILGVAMVMLVVIDVFAGKIIAAVIKLLGGDIDMYFFSTSLYGGGFEIVTVFVSVTVIELLVPLLYLHRKLRLPIKAELLNSVRHSYEIIGSIGTVLILCTAICLPAAYSSETKEVYNYFSNLDTNVSVWGQKEFVVYTVFDVLVFSFLSELIFHGAIFTALRQFGDAFALIITSGAAALITRDFIEMPAAMMISLAAGLGMLSSGTIFTAVIVQVVYKMYRLALIILQSDTSGNMFIIRNAAMLVLLIFGIIAFTVTYCIRKHSGEKRIAVYRSETPLSKFVCFSFRTFSFSAALVMCVMAALIKLTF